MILSKKEEAMASGKYGPGIEKCITFLIKYGDAFDADRLVKVSSAHVFNAFPLDLLEDLTEGVNQVETLTTTHPFMSLCDPSSYEKMGISREPCAQKISDHARRRKIYDRLGFFQTYSCVPMYLGNFPKKGDYVSWFGSSTQLFVNSIVGARQNRDGAVVNMAVALTGRAPNWGLFLDENRRGEVLFDLKGLDTNALTTTDLGAIGYYIGGIAQERNVAIDGLSPDIVLDSLKYLLHPISTSGAVSICHLVGITPEAPDLKTAMGHRDPEETFRVGVTDIRDTKEKYYGESGPIDLVILGCPHCSLQELKQIAALLDDRRVGSTQGLWLGTAHQLYDLAETMGYTGIIEKANGVISQSCMATIPDCPIPEGVQTVATNSFKTAHYVSIISKDRIKVLVGNIDQCVNAAITGHWEGEL
ncbi:MAG: aconitase X catalytic domain-containing protein [Deltaproteobacteria bacterium]|nr:aconitase X catalytic domain-containing protein [Deltaproteobacteria bacterium]